MNGTVNQQYKGSDELFTRKRPNSDIQFTQSADVSVLRRKWHLWIEKEIGGTPDRVEVATEAAMRAIVQGRGREEIVAAARRAASNTRIPTDTVKEKLGIVRGRVAGMQHRSFREPRRFTKTTIWNFLLTRTGPDGRPLAPIPLQMEGAKFEGSIDNGDEIEVDASRRLPYETLSVKKLRNLTTNSVVSVNIWGTESVLAVSIFLTLLLFVVFGALNNTNHFSRPTFNGRMPTPMPPRFYGPRPHSSR